MTTDEWQPAIFFSDICAISLFIWISSYVFFALIKIIAGWGIWSVWKYWNQPKAINPLILVDEFVIRFLKLLWSQRPLDSFCIDSWLKTLCPWRLPECDYNTTFRIKKVQNEQVIHDILFVLLHFPTVTVWNWKKRALKKTYMQTISFRFATTDSAI